MGAACGWGLDVAASLLPLALLSVPIGGVLVSRPSSRRILGKSVCCCRLTRLRCVTCKVGMLPPNSSDEEEAPAGRQRMVGMLPPNSSDEDEDPMPTREAPSRKKEEEHVIDAKTKKAQLAKLEEVRQRREQQRLQRIEREGFDRFTPAKPGENRPAAVRDSRQEESSSSDED